MYENLSFARKYRPNTLSNYIGNEKAKETLIEYLKNGRPQSFLFDGHSGCGKTTLARIVAKEYLCEDRDEDTGACNECMTCQLMNEYIATGNTEQLPDVYEIDATDKSGKKDIDSMLAGMDYPPMAGDWKVYIIDEVHKLSEGAMNRLLKSLEEPPEGVVMIFCTTEPDKLLETVKNRCQVKLTIKKPRTPDIIGLLKRVCNAEDKEYTVSGLRMIAVRAENVIRDSLNFLQQVCSTRGNATEESVSQEFQEVADSLIMDFYKAYLEKDYLEYINILYKIKTEFGFGQFLTSLTNFTTRGIYVLNSVNVEGLSKEELESYLKLFKMFTPKDISYVLSSLKRMRLGDIEANFMSFIYCERDERGEKEETSVSVPSSTVNSEVVMRNSNLQALEKAKLQEGSKSLKSELDEVGFSEMNEFFTFQKVTEES